MLQTLLEERFGLKVRVEVSMVDMLTLVVDHRDGTLGPKMKGWSGACRSGAPTEEDDPALPRCLAGLVSDHTGLASRYTMDLDYQFQRLRPADPADPPEVTGPTAN